jgi:hypothetical protein
VDVVLRDPPRQQQPQQDYGWPGETVSGPAARGSFTDAKKSCCGDLGETKTGEGIAVVRRGHQVSRRGCVIAATIRIVEAPQQRVQDGQKLGGDRAIVLALGPARQRLLSIITHK